MNPSDDAKLKPSDRIGAIPFVHRVEVQMGIKADGTSDWVISKREPKNPLKTVRTALPDPTPKAAVMKFKDNRLTTYDKNGKLLKSHDIDLNSMTKRFLEVLYPDPSLATLRSARTIQDIVAEARDQGATVTTTDNVKFCIRKDDPREGRYTITYLDGAIGKAVGSSIHKTNGDFIYSNNVMFKPNPNQANDYVVENMVERNFSTSSASGVAIVTEKITHFTSFQYTGN